MRTCRHTGFGQANSVQANSHKELNPPAEYLLLLKTKSLRQRRQQQPPLISPLTVLLQAAPANGAEDGAGEGIPLLSKLRVNCKLSINFGLTQAVLSQVASVQGRWTGGRDAS
jgi:hypothetical protein